LGDKDLRGKLESSGLDRGHVEPKVIDNNPSKKNHARRLSIPGPRRLGRAEFVYSRLKEQILDGYFARESWLPVDAIASDLDVSRQPVMEALKRLSMEGFVTIIPQVGCRVSCYEPEEIKDFYDLFSEAESLIAGLAAARSTEDEVIGLRVISEQIASLTKQQNVDGKVSRRYRVLNRRLHFEIREMAHSSTVAAVVEGLGDRSDFFVATVNAPIFASRLNTAHDEHEALIDAIAGHREHDAREIMKNHILAIGARLGDALSG